MAENGGLERVGEFGDWVMFRSGDGLVYCHKDTREITREEPAVVRRMRELVFDEEQRQAESPTADALAAPGPVAPVPAPSPAPAPAVVRVRSPIADQPPSPPRDLPPRSAVQPTAAPSGMGHRAARQPAGQLSQITFGGYGVVDQAASAAEPIGLHGMGYDRQAVQPRSERVLLRQGSRRAQEPASYQERTTAAAVMVVDDAPSSLHCKFGRRSQEPHAAVAGGVPDIGSDRQAALRGRAGAAAAQRQRGAGGGAPFALFGSDAHAQQPEAGEEPWTQRGRVGRRPGPARSAAPEQQPHEQQQSENTPDTLQCAVGPRGAEPVKLQRRAAAAPQSSSNLFGTADDTPAPQHGRRRHLTSCPAETHEDIAAAALAARSGVTKLGRRGPTGAGYASLAPYSGQYDVSPSGAQAPRGRHRGPNAVAAAAGGAPWAQAP